MVVLTFSNITLDMAKSVDTLTVRLNFEKLKDTLVTKHKYAARTMKMAHALMEFDVPSFMSTSPWPTQIFITTKKPLPTETHNRMLWSLRI